MSMSENRQVPVIFKDVLETLRKKEIDFQVCERGKNAWPCILLKAPDNKVDKLLLKLGFTHAKREKGDPIVRYEFKSFLEAIKLIHLSHIDIRWYSENDNGWEKISLECCSEKDDIFLKNIGFTRVERNAGYTIHYVYDSDKKFEKQQKGRVTRHDRKHRKKQKE